MNIWPSKPFTLSVLGAAVTLCALGSAARAQEPAPTPEPVPATPAPVAAPAAQPPVDAGQATPAKPPRRYPLVPVARPFRLQVGTLVATQDRVRDDINDNIFFVGVTLDLAATRGNRPAIFSAYVETMYGQNDNDPPVNRMESVGIGLSVRTYFNDVTRPTRFYGGLGLGAYNVTGKRDRLVDIPATIGNVPVSRLRYFADEESKTNFGGKVFLGAEFDRRFFGEVGFTAAGSAQDYSPTGALFSAGVRF